MCHVDICLQYLVYILVLTIYQSENCNARILIEDYFYTYNFLIYILSENFLFKQLSDRFLFK